MENTPQQIQSYVNKYIPYTIQGVQDVNALTTQDVYHLAVFAGHIGRMSAWLIGDCLVASERLYPQRSPAERYAEIVKLAGVDWSYGHAQNVARTCAVFPIAERHPDAPFEFHRIVSHLEKEEAHALIDLAVANEWAAAQLRKHLYPNATPPHNVDVTNISPQEMAIVFGGKSLHVFIVVDDDTPKLDYIWK